MAFDLNNTILNDVLSFIFTARDSLTSDDIISMSVAFYKHETIREAKEVLFSLCAEKLITRRCSKDYPNPTVHDVQDMVDVIVKMEGKAFLFPNFVAQGHMSLPPQSGFMALARSIASMRDEVASLRIELTQFREDKERDRKQLIDATSIHQDVCDIKTMLLNNIEKGTDSVMPIVSSAPPDETSNALAEISYANVVKIRRPSAEHQIIRQSRADCNANHISITNGQHESAEESNPVLGSGSAGSANFNTRQYDRKNKQKLHRKKVTITGTNTGNETFTAAPRPQKSLDIYVGGCAINTKTEDILEYCQRKTNIENLQCCELPNKSNWNKCFKVSISAEKRDLLLDADFWPNGILVRKYYKPFVRKYQQVEFQS